jgi:hypothetical protein
METTFVPSPAPPLSAIKVQRVLTDGRTFGWTSQYGCKGEEIKYWSWNRAQRPVEITEIERETFFKFS